MGTFRRLIDVDPGDLFESRYFLVLGDVDHIGTTIEDRNLVPHAIYGKRIISVQDSDVLAWTIVETNGEFSVLTAGTGQTTDFLTYAHPVNGSQPLFLFEDVIGNEFISIDPYALSATPYDGQTNYKGILGFVLPAELADSDAEHIDLATLFQGDDFYLNTDPTISSFVVASDAAARDILLGDVNQDGIVDFLDISPFIGLLSTGGFLEEADCNQDGAVDFQDISPFIVILASN